MSIWYTEKHTPHSGITVEVKRTLYHGQSQFQTLDILDTHEFGRMFLLDGLVMLTERDEFVYHEMLTHVPLNTHPSPGKVLVIGGGDGGTVREILKHPAVKEVTLVEIDRMVVETALEYLPGISEGLKDPRTRVVYEDGVRFVADAQPGSFDVILVDSTDPVGPAEALFTAGFFQDCARALGPDGVFVTQSESPFYHHRFMVDIHQRMKGVYPQAAFYFASIPTYPSGSWSFLMGCRSARNPIPVCRDHAPLSTRYYNPAIHVASFAAPQFLVEELAAK